MKLLLMGLSYKTAPVEIREQLDFSAAVLRSVLTHFDSTHEQAHLPEVTEGLILSTCNRMELYAVVRRSETAVPAIIELLSRACDTSPAAFAEHLYIKEDSEAIDHLFHVACGLDSLVLGEPQILGQVTDAYEAALSQKSAGMVLSRLFRAAIHAGKRARTETRIGMNPASISSVAANLAQRLLGGDLAVKQLMLVGAGEMGQIAAKALVRRGLQRVVVVNRTFETAQTLAHTLGGRALTFPQMAAAVPETDILISATGAPHMVVNKAMLASPMQQRANRPLFIIDIAVPRDVDHDVTDLPNVHLRNIDDLGGQAADNVQERQQEVPLVDAIIAEEVEQILTWLSTLDVVSTITDLRRECEQLRRTELERLFNKLDISERERELVATMSHRLVSKILYKPTVRLKHEAACGDGATYTSTVRDLFELEPSEPAAAANGDRPAKNSSGETVRRETAARPTLHVEANKS